MTRTMFPLAPARALSLAAVLGGFPSGVAAKLVLCTKEQLKNLTFECEEELK
jgi:hypothetical protein